MSARWVRRIGVAALFALAGAVAIVLILIGDLALLDVLGRAIE